MNNKIKALIPMFFATILSACANIGTPPEQITGTYVSPVKYQHYTCSQLMTEKSSLSRRQSALIIAQKSRVSSNEVQAFWYGYGDGDGIEAAELANVKGDYEAVTHTINQKNCK